MKQTQESCCKILFQYINIVIQIHKTQYHENTIQSWRIIRDNEIAIDVLFMIIHLSIITFRPRLCRKTLFDTVNFYTYFSFSVASICYNNIVTIYVLSSFICWLRDSIKDYDEWTLSQIFCYEDNNSRHNILILSNKTRVWSDLTSYFHICSEEGRWSNLSWHWIK